MESESLSSVNLSLSVSAVCQPVGALCGSRVEEGAPETSGESALPLLPLFLLPVIFLSPGSRGNWARLSRREQTG